MTEFKSEGKKGELKGLDYLLIGVLTLLTHFYILQRFHDTAKSEEIITPVKVPPMVQVTLIPPPKPIVQPPPPPPPEVKKVEPKKVEPKKVELPKPPPKKVVAIKPQPKPKPVIRRVEPIREPTPAIEEEEPPPEPVRAAPVKATPTPQPAPPAPAVEKVSPPSAGAGYLHNPAPSYPEMAEEQGWEGRVLLKVHVLASGRPDSVSVQKSSGHDILDQAAVRTVKGSWHFAPAMRGDTPTDGWVTVPIVFNLPG